jgi:hypothetical protein
MREALRTIPRTEVTLFRGMGMSAKDATLYAEGVELHQPALSSWSLSYEVGRNFSTRGGPVSVLLKVRSRTASDLRFERSHVAEQEFVIDKTTVFRVRRVVRLHADNPQLKGQIPNDLLEEIKASPGGGAWAQGRPGMIIVELDEVGMLPGAK